MLLLLGLTAMSLIIFSISVSLGKTEVNLVTAELNFFADSTKDRLLQTYILANGSDSATGLFSMDLPQKVGNRRYSVTLHDGGLFVNTTVRGTDIGVSRSLPIDAQMNGTSFMPASIEVEKQAGRIRMMIR